jgi:sterol desaturase/sphingolipid hydroxylase (fatty acid hydroxylase superfamily)
MNAEGAVRLGFFCGVFVVMAFWEVGAPRRQLTVKKIERWLNNLGIVFLDTVILRLLLPAAAIGVATAAGRNNWGLLNYLQVPAPLAVAAGVLLLDLVIYLQHLMFHAVPLLWRLHMVHHADLNIDCSTDAFHPIEILSMAVRWQHWQGWGRGNGSADL